jgi:hypothetical protein
MAQPLQPAIQQTSDARGCRYWAAITGNGIGDYRVALPFLESVIAGRTP